MLSSYFEFLSSLSALANLNDVVVDLSKVFWIVFACSAVIEVALFVLKGIGLYTIGKRENIPNGYLAFIPFASYYYMGKIIGPVKLFGYRLKNIGLLLSLLYFFTFATGIAFDALYYGNTLMHLLQTGTLVKQEIINVTLFRTITLHGLISVTNNILVIMYLVIDVFTVFAFFRFYAKKNQNMYSFLAIFIEPLFPIFVFAFRNNKRFDYNQYMKMRFESYKAQGSQGGYNNPKQPYTQEPEKKDGFPFEDYDAPSDQHAPEDVFAEYASKNDSEKKADTQPSNQGQTKENDDGDLF